MNFIKPKAAYFDYNASFVCECNNGVIQKVYKSECIFYAEDHDMGATIPYCLCCGINDACSCSECSKYIRRENSHELNKN